MNRTAVPKITASPAVYEKDADEGASADYMDPKKLDAYSKAELARWGEVVKGSKIEAD